MAGKTAAKKKINGEPIIDMNLINDIVYRIDKIEDNIGGVVKMIDELGLSALSNRVEKVEARLGIG